MPEKPASKDGTATDRGTQIIDARRVRTVAILAIVVVWFQAGVLGTVGTVSGAAVQFVIVAVAGYAGLTTSDAILDRLTRDEE